MYGWGGVYLFMLCMFIRCVCVCMLDVMCVGLLLLYACVSVRVGIAVCTYMFSVVMHLFKYASYHSSAYSVILVHAQQ